MAPFFIRFVNTLTRAEGNRWTAGSDVDVAAIGGVASYELLLPPILLRRRQLGKYSSVVGIPPLGKGEGGRGSRICASFYGDTMEMELLVPCVVREKHN